MNKSLLALIGVFALMLGACTDSVDYEESRPIEGQGVYFPTTQVSAITINKVSGSFVINISRSKSDGALDENLSFTISEEATGLFTIPSKVSFADGETTSKVTVDYQNIVEGKKYTIILSVADGTLYANSSQTFTVTFVSPDSDIWETVSEKAVYIDNLFSPYGAKNIMKEKLKVEKAKGKNKYRFLSPYDNAYFLALFDSELFSEDFVLPYIILDGDTYKAADDSPLWYLAKTKLGFNMVDGEGPKYDSEWNTFGSVAYNTSGTTDKYPLGTYDAKTKMFDFGACYHNLGGYGLLPLASGLFNLYLDPNLMVPDYDRDYTWEVMPDAEGYFNSTVTKEKWMQPVQQAKEDSTFYRFPSLYTNGVALYFHYDMKKGTLTMPKGQVTGLTTFGNKVYMDAKTNGTIVNQKTNTFSFRLSLYLVGEDGKKVAELLEATETFLWAQGPLDQLEKGKKIEDYVGSWKVAFTDFGTNEKFNSVVNISKADANTLHVKGLSLIKEYDDTMTLTYDTQTGLLNFAGQPAKPHQGFDLFIVPFNTTTFKFSDVEPLIGGLTADGKIMFLDTPGNKGTYDAMAYLLEDKGEISLATGYGNSLIWEPTNSAKSFATKRNLNPPTKNKITKQSTSAKQVRKTELNLKGKPVQAKKSLKITLTGTHTPLMDR